MTTPSLARIRLLTPADAPRYRDIRLEGLKQDPLAFSLTFERENAMPLSWFEERIVKGNVFGAFVDDELLGVAGYWPLEGVKVSHKAGLWGMYVRKAARGSGLGQRLVGAIIGHASGKAEQLVLGVTGDNGGRPPALQENGIFGIWPRNEGLEARRAVFRRDPDGQVPRLRWLKLCQNRM